MFPPHRTVTTWGSPCPGLLARHRNSGSPTTLEPAVAKPPGHSYNLTRIPELAKVQVKKSESSKQVILWPPGD